MYLRGILMPRFHIQRCDQSFELFLRRILASTAGVELDSAQQYL